MDQAEYQRQYRLKNKERIRQQRKEYRERNKSKLQAEKRAYYESHKEEKAQYDKEYRLKNADRISQAKAEYRQKNKDYIKQQASEYRTSNPEANRKYQLKRNYGITPEDYDKMYNEQHGRCAICGKHQSEMKTNLFVDHNHDTGAVRGLLCQKCNSGLGYFNDNIEIIKMVLTYLKETNNVA